MRFASTHIQSIDFDVRKIMANFYMKMHMRMVLSVCEGEWWGCSRRNPHDTSICWCITCKNFQLALSSVRCLALARVETQTQSYYNHHHLFSQLSFCVNIHYSVRFRSNRILYRLSTRARVEGRCIGRKRKKR